MRWAIFIDGTESLRLWSILHAGLVSIIILLRRLLLFIANSIKGVLILSIARIRLELQIVMGIFKLLFNCAIAHSFEAEEAFQALVLFVRAVLVVDAASIHHAFAVEELEV